MKNISKIMFFTVPILLIFSVFFIRYKNKEDKIRFNKYRSEYWEQCDVEFCGIVKNKVQIERGGYVCLDLIYSNKKGDYTFLVNDEIFVCQIKNNKILFVTTVSDLKVGDSICYNIEKSKSRIIYRNGKEIKRVIGSVVADNFKNHHYQNYQCNE